MGGPANEFPGLSIRRLKEGILTGWGGLFDGAKIQLVYFGVVGGSGDR